MINQIKKTFLVLITIFLTFNCKTVVESNNIISKYSPEDLQIILDSIPIINDSIFFKIINNSNKNSYYFPLETKVTNLGKGLGYLEEDNFYADFIFNKIENKENNLPYFGGESVYYNEKIRKQDKIKKQEYLKTFDFNKIIKIKPKEILSFTIPQTDNYKDYFTNPKYYLFDSEQEYLYFGVVIKNKWYIRDMPSETINKLEQNGFKLYNNKITSNKIRIKISNKPLGQN